MIQITTNDLSLSIDNSRLTTLNVYDSQQARLALADIWKVDTEDLMQYQALFFDKSINQLDDKQSFITLSSSSHGYVADADEFIDAAEAKTQIEIDLEIINRESQWSAEDSIYFDTWWPAPIMDSENHILEFGVSLKDYHQKVFNRTLNRIILTRYGHLSLNYSLAESDVDNAQSLPYYRQKLDEIIDAITISEGYRYQDVDEDNDMPSRSRLINLILSSEIF